MPQEMMTDHDNGAYASEGDRSRIPGRFRFASFGTDGLMPISSIAQDPL